MAICGLMCLVSCNKEPGIGGKAEIRGRLMEQETSDSGNPIGDPYPIIGENVYIIYGDGSDGAYPDDNVDSGPNGEFRFPWLRKGSYRIYAVSDCEDCDGGSTTVSATVEISDRKEVVEMGDLTVIKLLN